MVQESLIGISEASTFLGVSEASLRQWTDKGKIKAFITPGGHRRYSKIELKKFVISHPKMFDIKDFVNKLQETNEQLREIGRETLKNTAWYSELSDEEKRYLADIGRRLLNQIIKYISEPSRREETMGQVHETGHDLGVMLAKLNLPLTDSVEAFILHRDPIMNATTHFIRKREAFTGRVVKAIPIVARILDEALIALIAAHQQYRNGIHSRIDWSETK